MAEQPIALDRRFIPWTESEHHSFIGEFGDLLAGHEALAWKDLLEKHRVVILAEAGSGKSTEIAEQVRLLQQSDKEVFLATVRDVGQHGLEKALGRAHARRWQTWRKSSEPAWLFVDSVDEAKANDVRLADVLRTLADAIEDVEDRVHIVLTGRYTDWEFRADLAQLERWLSMAPADKAPPPVDLDPDELLLRALRTEDREEKPEPAEAPLVVVMSALDRSQVKKFARGKRVASVDAFIEGLEVNDLWSFVRRPLDLTWLVDYWRSKGRFGTLEEMLDVSLRERLRETDPQRYRTDPITEERATHALERLGAALVLQGRTDIVVPDANFELAGDTQGINLAQVLPDWTPEYRSRLITRAVFDPAHVGFARVHNDNEGTVASYLAARWLNGLIENNCPAAAIRDLLFADTYGIQLVVPSLRSTAAWLSLWHAEVRAEVIKREPRLLMDAGDPASLPKAAREEVLSRVVERTVEEEHQELYDRDSLKRFARPDMAGCVRALWDKHGHVPAVKRLLLTLISFGPLHACADLAMAAWSDPHSDERVRTYAGRAVAAAGSTNDQHRLARDITERAADLPSHAVWDGVDALFPTYITVSDVGPILDAQRESKQGIGFDYLGPRLPERLESPGACEEFIRLLLPRVPPVDDERPPSTHEDRLLDAIEVAAYRLLELSGHEQAPAAAIDAALCIAERPENRRAARTTAEKPSLDALLTSSAARRRTALWAAVAHLNGSPRLAQSPITETWELEMLGFQHGLTVEDIPWLLEDARHRNADNERQVAANAIVALWHKTGRAEDVLSGLRTQASGIPELAAQIDRATSPVQETEHQREHRKKMRALKKRGIVERAKRDKSWREFAADLRKDPEQLRKLDPPSEKTVDGRLLTLHRLLSGIGRNRSRFAIGDLSPLIPILGVPVVDALRFAFVEFWRQWAPTLSAERSPEIRNRINPRDMIGMVGVTLESTADPNWARKLTHQDAVLAAVYATHELNGFPSWLLDLALAHPKAVGEVLWRTITEELTRADGSVRAHELEDIARADVRIRATIAQDLLQYLRDHPALPATLLRPILTIVCSANFDKTHVPLLRQRFEAADAPAESAAYYEWLFALDAEAGLLALMAKVDALDRDNQTRFGQSILVQLMGERWEDPMAVLGRIPLSVLERMVLIAYRAVHPDEDNDHADGETYSPDERDDAESARSKLLQELSRRPGVATFDALHRLVANPEFPIPAYYLLRMVHRRAGDDSEREHWLAADVVAFEQDCTMRPRHPHDLQRLILGQLRDLQYDLLNADSAQGPTLTLLPDEEAVQNFIADRMRALARASYTLEREVRVVDEKEPDIRFQVQGSGAKVPVEIKVAESWDLAQLEDALVKQLIGRYLRDRENRYGILLLVHQKPRPRGWRAADGTWIPFDDVVTHLRALARSSASADGTAPQCEIAVIDVSSKYVATPPPRAGAKGRNGSPEKSGTRTSSRKKSRKNRAGKNRAGKKQAGRARATRSGRSRRT